MSNNMKEEYFYIYQRGTQDIKFADAFESLTREFPVRRRLYHTSVGVKNGEERRDRK